MRGYPGIHVLAVIAGAAGSCEPAPPEPVAPLALLGTSVDDGAPVSPTATLALRFSSALDPASVSDGTVVMVRGMLDDDLRAKIEHAAVPDDQRDLLAPLRLAVDGATVHATPARPLAGETLYTLLATTAVSADGRRLAATEERACRTLPDSSAAPWLQLVAPSAGSDNVVRNLRAVDVRFSRPVTGVDEGTLSLLDEHGEAVAARIDPTGDGTGYRLSLGAPLRALRRYHVDAANAIRDDEGEPPFATDLPAQFTAGTEGRDRAPTVTSVELSASSGCLVVRLATDPPTDSRLCVDGDCAWEPAREAARVLVHRLAFGAAAVVSIAARDESTAPPAIVGPLAAPATSPRTLVISEVLSRPKGPHYAQQFVELRNVGDAPVELGGLELHGGQGFDVLPAGVLAAGGFALVVPAGFTTDDGVDEPPATGTVIVRVDASRLVGSGLRVAGEAVALIEPDGRPVSRFSTARLKLSSGQSARRSGPCDVDGSWEPTPLAGGGATPGGP